LGKIYFNVIEKHKKVNVKKIITTLEEYKSYENNPLSDVDLILFIGWSWIIPESFTESNICLGIHPSDLPYYRGGSPPQNQIIDGMIESKISLITLSNKLDAGDIWLKKDFSLVGDSMEKVFENLIQSSIKLLNDFFNIYPNIKPETQDITKGSYFRGRRPEESKISLNDFKSMSLFEIYNFIRCLTDPYPNAYIEDEDGNKLVFKNITYVSSKNN